MDEWDAFRERVYGLTNTQRRVVLAYLAGYATDAVQRALDYLDACESDV